jgi:inner membrane protein involved in colicin E2 resistance
LIFYTVFWNDLPFILGLHPNQTELRKIVNERVQSRKQVAFMVTRESQKEDKIYVNDIIAEYKEWYRRELLDDLEYKNYHLLYNTL